MNIDMNNENTKNEHVRKVIFTGVMAALSYVVFTFLQIKITLPGGDATSIHLGNAVCVLGALLLGGVYGGLGGAIGMTIGDLLDPIYVVYASLPTSWGMSPRKRITGKYGNGPLSRP